MHRRHSTITPAVVRDEAHLPLRAALAWTPYGRLVSVAQLIHLLWLIAATCSSLRAVIRCFRFGFSHETARKAVQAHTTCVETLTHGLVDALVAFVPRDIRRRRLDVAIDSHFRPFYGSATTPDVVSGQQKAGSTCHDGCATAMLLTPDARDTVGLVAIAPGDTPHQIVHKLLAQITARGSRHAVWCSMRASTPAKRADGRVDDQEVPLRGPD